VSDYLIICVILDIPGALIIPVPGKGKKIPFVSSLVLFNQIPMVPVCRKDRQDIFNPFAIIGVSQPVNMGQDMRVMPMGFLCTGSVGMLHLVVL
jgi:hypothetical protein